VNILVDTSVWSLALRRDAPPPRPEILFLREALEGGETIFTTGLVLQELLQGFRGPKGRERIVNRFSLLPSLVPSRDDHVRAAELYTACRRKGIQLGTVGALLAQLCVHHRLTLLTTDQDFGQIARVRPLTVWQA
jgi:predicted nucleic acid-binding protein